MNTQADLGKHHVCWIIGEAGQVPGPRPVAVSRAGAEAMPGATPLRDWSWN